jgi:outer membrane protein assembly factor BamB
LNSPRCRQTPRRPLVHFVGIIAAMALIPGIASTSPELMARKPLSHRLIAQDKGHVVILSAKGEVEWEAPCLFVSHDIAVLPNGNLLLHTGPATVTEMTPAKQIVWEYTSKPKPPYDGTVDVHAFQRLKDGRTMIAETGNRRIIEVDREGKIVHEVPITVDHPSSHRDTRRVRKLDNGNYLACHEGDGTVREYDSTGKVVWSYNLDLAGQPRTPNHDGHGVEVFNALRLPNGNTLIGGGNNNRVFEVTPGGKTVWSIERDELPGIHLCWITSLQVLPNGNIVFGNTHAGPENPQIIEVTRDKKVVWTFKNFDLLGNDLCASQLLDVKGKVIR